MQKRIKIGDKYIGEGEPCYIVAEISGNHLQDFDRAKAIIKAAADAGVDAVKLQTYTADTITLDCDNDYFQITQGTIWDGTSLHKLYEEAYTPWDWDKPLFEYAHELGIECFSTPFDPTAVDLMEEIGMPVYKIASFEINDIPLIRKIAKLGKPMIFATGIAYLEDIERAVAVCKEEGNDQVVLLKCTSQYPSPYEDMNIKVIPNMAEVFDCVTGISDHSMGNAVDVAAVALGAKMVEKHLTLKRADGGPDAEFSMEPEEFKRMVDEIRIVEKAMGKVTYELTPQQIRSREDGRSLFVCADIKKGEEFTEKNVRSVRPNFGMHTMYYEQILGKKATQDIAFGTPMDWKYVDLED